VTASLDILSPGLATTVQDLGRPGYLHLGIPAGGALDAFSLRAANALVGNAPDVGALEIAYRGPRFRVAVRSARIACFGASASIVLRREGVRRKLDVGRSHCLLLGDEVDIGAVAGAAILYAAFEGGFDIAPALGAVSTYVRGGLGGWHGRALKAGDRLPLARHRVEDRAEAMLEGLELPPTRCLRVVDGPQTDHFADDQIAAFYNSEYGVGSGADRMGARLFGSPVSPARGHDIVSDAISLGSIQIPGDGQPIVLRCEHQTTGGYPKIATVISADWPALGRLAIGDKVRFQRVTMDEADAARRAYAVSVESLPTRITPVPVEVDLASRLWAANLISGVCDARLNLD